MSPEPHEVATEVAAFLASNEHAARSIVVKAVAAVVHPFGPAKAAFDDYLRDPSAQGARKAFVNALQKVLSNDSAALRRVMDALERDRSHTRHDTPGYRDILDGDGIVLEHMYRSEPSWGEQVGRVLRKISPLKSHRDDRTPEEAVPSAGDVPVPARRKRVRPPVDAPEAAAPEAAAPEADLRDATGAVAPSDYRAYPLLKPAAQLAGREFLLEPDVTFDLQVGLSSSPPVAPIVIASPAGLGEVRAGLVVDVQVSYDPASFRIEGPAPLTLHLTEEERYPHATIQVTPLPTPEPLSNRRIAAHYMVDGKLRAIAFRTFRDADAAATEPLAPAGLVDLTPLADEEPPDVILAIYGADASSPGTFTMAAFPRNAAIAPPEIGRIELGSDSAALMDQMFKEGNRSNDPTGVYDTITGIGWRIGNQIPPGILRTLKAIAEDPARTSPPTMLLLTEESHVPWELAALGQKRAISSAAGGRSPFLGAHFAIGRWPIAKSTPSAPGPDPRRIDVHNAALVRADYDGVGEGWRPLLGAEKEVAELAKSYTPAVEWPPLIDEVKENLFSDVDVIHFALHGRVDGTVAESGLVLLRKDEKGKLRPAYLGADEILGLLTRDPGPFPHRPFVFLNACQVGQSGELLGDYAGLAAAFIEAGARAVVACIWNVNDGLAGSISREFYLRTDAGEAPAEILRSVRTRYVRPVKDAQQAADPATMSVPTLLAYQYFGHPGLRVVRSN